MKNLDDLIDFCKKNSCPYKVGDLVQARWMRSPGVVLEIYDDGQIRVKEDDWCTGTLPWRFYKKVKRAVQLDLFEASL